MSLETVTPYLTDDICNLILSLPKEILRQLTEIRIRRNLPVVLVFGRQSLFVTESGKLLNFASDYCYVVYDEEFDLLYKRLSNYSVHTVIDDVVNGFITLNGGNRVGIASTAVIKENIVFSVKDVSSFNIRIAKEVKNCARQIMNTLYVNELPSIIVASPPAGGKTTFLRDLGRLLSSGFNSKYRKISFIDERCEIAFKNSGKIIADIGVNSDVISAFPKAKGIEIAIRSLSPEYIICDEITSLNEVYQIEQGFLSGVGFAVSVHASSLQDIVNKPIVQRLICSGNFKYVVLLKNYTNDFDITEVSEIRSEICGNYFDKFGINTDRYKYGL